MECARGALDRGAPTLRELYWDRPAPVWGSGALRTVEGTCWPLASARCRVAGAIRVLLWAARGVPPLEMGREAWAVLRGAFVNPEPARVRGVAAAGARLGLTRGLTRAACGRL